MLSHRAHQLLLVTITYHVHRVPQNHRHARDANREPRPYAWAETRLFMLSVRAHRALMHAQGMRSGGPEPWLLWETCRSEV